ncbi:MAG: translocation/assembly module TamB [Treponema sp.]|nr:translocation/assembly module TamB [Treponema sp.]
MPEQKEQKERLKAAFPFASVGIRILIFTVLVAGTALALRPLQTGLLQRMEDSRDEFFSRAESYLGRRIQYGSMGPSIFGALDIRDVRVLREDDSVLLSISRLRLSYSLFGLLRGNLLESFHFVRVDRPVLSLDIERDSDLVERFALNGERNGHALAQTDVQQGIQNIQSLHELLPGDFSLRIWNGQWDMSGQLGKVSVQGVELDASVQNGRIGFDGRWNASGALNGGTGFQTVMAVQISGEYLYAKEEGSATVVIPSFHGDRFRVNPLNINFSLSDGILKASKTHSRSPTAIVLVYDIEDGRLQGNFEGENFPLSDLLAFTGLWAEHNPALALMISGSASIERERLGSPVYNVSFSGFLPGSPAEGPVYMAFSAWGNGRHIEIETLEIQSPDGGLSFHGGMDLYAAAPYGFLALSNFSLRGGAGISGDFSLSAQGREINLFGENLSAGNAGLAVLDASLFREEAGLAFSLSAENTRAGTMLLEGSVDHGPRQVRAALMLDAFSVGDILSFAEPLASLSGLPPLARFAADDTYVTADFFFTSYCQHILFHAPRLVIAYTGGMGDDFLFSASLSGTERRFDLNAGQFSWPAGTLDVLASANFSDLDDISFSLGATRSDLTYYLEGLITDRRDVSVTGSHGFTLNISGTEDGTRYGYARGDNIPIPSGDRLASLSFLLSLDYASPSSWQAALERFEITGFVTPSSPFASLRFSGIASEEGLDIPLISFNDGRGTLEGGISVVRDTSSPYSYYLFDVDIRGGGGTEHYILGGTFRDNRLDLAFSGMGMQLARVSAHNAVADASLRLSWESIRSFDIEAELSSLVLRRANETVTASALAAMNHETFTLSNVVVGYSGLHASVPGLTIDRAASHAQTQGLIRGNFHQRLVDVSFRGETVFSSTDTWLDMLRDLSFLEGSLTFDAARYDTLEADEPFRFEFSSVRKEEGFTMNLTGGPRNMLRLRYSPGVDEGSFFAALSAPSPVRGSVAGVIGGGTIDVNSPDLYVDMGALWRFIPPHAPVAFPSGIVSGSVRVAGSLSDPGFYGILRGTGVHLMVPDFIPEPIRPTPVTFLLSGSEMTFGPVDAAVGRGGGGQAFAWFGFEYWIPSLFNIDIRVPQETPIPYDFEISGLMANGLASGRLVLAMEDQVFSVTGDLTAHNTEISLDTDLMWEDDLAVNGSGASSMTFLADVSIRTGRRVEFFWPTVNFPILQATADMGTGIHITSDSATGRFSLNGDVQLRAGEIFYLERNFYIREGTLFFNETETEFDPRITARAEMRDVADIVPVIISMIIDNAPLVSFTPRFESTPPLSPVEVFSLLGHVPQGEEAPRNLAASVALDSLAHFAVMRRVQRQVRDFLGLDMFSVRTQVFQNMLMQTIAPQPQFGDDPNFNRNYRVGNYFDNTTVFMGRYFGAAVFGQAMLSFRYDESRLSMGGVLLEPELGFEMRNPLFDIRFSMIPLHPENWFIDDISVSLLWRGTFF